MVINPEPHEAVVASALKTVKQLGKLTDRLRGPRSAVHSAYRTVLRALRGYTDNPVIVADAMATLEASVRAACADYYDDAITIGFAQAQRDLKIYDLGLPDQPDPSSTVVASASTIGVVRQQADQAIAVARLDMGDEYIVGDATRKGIVQPNPIIQEMAFWLTGLTVLSYDAGTKRKMPTVLRQAVAQIDGDTTPCCLAVHGQIVGEDEDFHLTEPPKYASRMYASPFHRGCRTAVAKILPRYLDEDVTREMRREAIEQSKKPKPSKMVGRAHYKVVGKSVHVFRRGRWHLYKRYDTNLAARSAAAKLNR